MAKDTIFFQVMDTDTNWRTGGTILKRETCNNPATAAKILAQLLKSSEFKNTPCGYLRATCKGEVVFEFGNTEGTNIMPRPGEIKKAFADALARYDWE